MSRLEFFKKEIFEILKTPKIIVLPAVALFFGMLSPITAKFINELIKALGGGISINIPVPTYLDSYAQFFKNHYTITTIVMIFVFMGLVAEEKQRGSAILVLTKNLSRLNFVLSKFFASILLFTFAYVISAIVCIYYTFILFDKFWNPDLPLAIFMFWLYGVFLIALILFASIIAKAPAIAALFGFIGYVFVSVVSSLPTIGKFSPGNMYELGLFTMLDKRLPADSIYPIVTSIILILILIISGIQIFKRQEL